MKNDLAWWRGIIWHLLRYFPVSSAAGRWWRGIGRRDLRWVAVTEMSGTVHCEIEEAPPAGFYLYVWWGDIGLMDHLQDEFAIAQEQALQEFGVPMDAWEPVAGASRRWRATSTKKWDMRLYITAERKKRFSVQLLGNGKQFYYRLFESLTAAQRCTQEWFKVPTTAWRQIKAEP